MTKLYVIVERLVREKAGQDLVEYALLAGFIAVAAGALLPNISKRASARSSAGCLRFWLALLHRPGRILQSPVEAPGLAGDSCFCGTLLLKWSVMNRAFRSSPTRLQGRIAAAASSSRGAGAQP